jgi:hypothetical protein
VNDRSQNRDGVRTASRPSRLTVVEVRMPVVSIRDSDTERPTGGSVGYCMPLPSRGLGGSQSLSLSHQGVAPPARAHWHDGIAARSRTQVELEVGAPARGHHETQPTTTAPHASRLAARASRRPPQGHALALGHLRVATAAGRRPRGRYGPAVTVCRPTTQSAHTLTTAPSTIVGRRALTGRAR